MADLSFYQQLVLEDPRCCADVIFDPEYDIPLHHLSIELEKPWPSEVF